jgi:acetyltransferase-like isoleucine patch superfamily enzyme
MITSHRVMGGTHLEIREVITVVVVVMTNITSHLQAEVTSHLSLTTVGLMVVEVANSIVKKRLNTNLRRGMFQEDKSTVTITVTRNHHLSRRATSETTNNITIGTPTTITTRVAVGTTTSRRTTSHRVSPPTTMRMRSTPKSFPP